MRLTLIGAYAMAFAAFGHVVYQELGGDPNILGLGLNLALGIAFASLLTRGPR